MRVTFRRLFALSMFLVPLLLCTQAAAVEPGQTALYDRIRAFDLDKGAVFEISNLVLKRDRIELTLSGQFYAQQAIDGKVYGGVLLGGGKIKVTPTSSFEKENLKRLLKTEVIETTFTNAVLRFTDDTYDQLLAHGARVAASAFDGAQKMARECDEHTMREVGLNAAQRVAVSVADGDDPGFFFAEFSGSSYGRFSAVVDHQSRIPTSIFDINGGEKGVLYQYISPERGTDTWMAFYDDHDTQQRIASYADAFDLVHVTDYRFNVDLRQRKQLTMDVEMDLLALRDGVRVVPFDLNNGLEDFREERLKKSLRVSAAMLADGSPVGVIQESWQKGFALVLPRALPKGEKLTVKCHLESKDYMREWQGAFYYPDSSTDWIPSHGYLRHSRYDITFHHHAKTAVASVGERVLEAADPASPGDQVTRWVMGEPVPLVTFAVGPFELHKDMATVNGRKIPVELFSLPWKFGEVKEDFVLAELVNGVQYYSALYGDFPYKRMGAVYFPAYFGQGFPTLLLLPVSGKLREATFISHESAHEWWGDQITWRSYRDQWLSEGFAEYSAMLYTEKRRDRKWQREIITRDRDELVLPSIGEFTWRNKEKLYETGPLIMGHRLASRESPYAYSFLTYGKGALVLRMLHFLFTDPATGNDDAFFTMMKDFAQRYHDRPATTENFFDVATEHFTRSPIGRQVGAQSLDWFLQQWVYQTGLPSYRLDYAIQPNPSGGVMFVGTVYQDGVENWFMPLPLILEFSGGRSARVAVFGYGASAPVKLALPEEPKSVKLDPDLWVLTQKTSVHKVDAGRVLTPAAKH